MLLPARELTRGKDRLRIRTPVYALYGCLILRLEFSVPHPIILLEERGSIRTVVHLEARVEPVHPSLSQPLVQRLEFVRLHAGLLACDIEVFQFFWHEFHRVIKLVLGICLIDTWRGNIFWCGILLSLYRPVTFHRHLLHSLVLVPVFMSSRLLAFRWRLCLLLPYLGRWTTGAFLGGHGSQEFFTYELIDVWKVHFSLVIKPDRSGVLAWQPCVGCLIKRWEPIS